MVSKMLWIHSQMVLNDGNTLPATLSQRAIVQGRSILIISSEKHVKTFTVISFSEIFVNVLL